MSSRFDEIVNNNPKMRRILIFLNSTIIILLQPFVFHYAFITFDMNNLVPLIILLIGGILILTISHYVVLNHFKYKLKFKREFKLFEDYVNKNNLKYPSIGYLLLVSFMFFILTGLISYSKIEGDIHTYSDTICCGKIYEISKTYKRSQTFVKYNFLYKDKYYSGTTSKDLKEYYNYFNTPVGAPIFSDDEFSVVLHKNKPWHNDLAYDYPSHKSIDNFKYALNNHPLFDLRPLIDSIYNKYGYFGLIAFYHRDRKNMDKIDRAFLKNIVWIQYDSVFINMINDYKTHQLDTLTNK